MKELAGKLNGKQKAIGFILFMPLYLYIMPRFLAYIIYLLIKINIVKADLTLLNIILNVIHSFICTVFMVVLLKDFIIDNIKIFKEKPLKNILWSFTVGLISLYAVSIILNLIVSLITGQTDNSSSNQVLVEAYAKKNIILMVISSVILAPILEELMFRGLIFRSLDKYGLFVSLFVSSFLFGFVHVYQSVLTGDFIQLLLMIPYIGMGAVLGFAYKKTGSIIPSMLIHMANNSIAMILLCFL